MTTHTPTDPVGTPPPGPALIGRIGAVPAILQLLCDSTGLGFAAVARVTEHRWTACAVLDRIGFGLRPGDELDIATTFCRDVRVTLRPILMEKASEDPRYWGHPVPRMHGFESYVSVPVIRRNGEVFGTICGLDPEPRRLDGPRLLAMLALFAELVASQLELEERDLASRTALVDATTAGALRDQFIAVLGHDLRNPIAAVAAGLDLLSRGPLPGREAGIVAQMKQSCRRMSGLVNDVLDFARGQLGGGIPVERRPVAAMEAVLREVVEELRPAHPDRAVETAIDIRAAVHCDPERVAQLLSNLLGNALTHGAPGNAVRVAARAEGGGLVLSVANAGDPIPAATMARLFRPFSRGGNPLRDGLGLGLYIAAEIAEAHGGRLGVTSTAEATTFTLDLPPEPG